MQFLSTEKNIRALGSVQAGQTNHNLDEKGTSYNSFLSNTLGASVTTNPQEVFNASLASWSNPTNTVRLVGGDTSLASNHAPVPSSNPSVGANTFDRLHKDTVPTMLKSKEEVAPTYLFDNY